MWEPKELELPDVEDEFHGRKDTFINMDRVDTAMLNTGSTDYIVVDEGWIITYVRK